MNQQIVFQEAQGQMYIRVNFTYKTLYKGETTKGKYTTCISNTPSNSRWINHIEFEKKKTMLSSSVGLGN
jgi:hypothetical protein